MQGVLIICFFVFKLFVIVTFVHHLLGILPGHSVGVTV